MFDLAKKASEGDWARLGIPSSQGVLNPGMSVWIFGALAKIVLGLGFELNPITLSMSVAALSCAAFALAVWIGFRLWGSGKTPSSALSNWVWGLALLATHPIEIILQRKIWAQSVIPILMVTWFFCLYRWLEDSESSKRFRKIFAFFTGLFLLIPGQIHMPAFFFTASSIGVLGWIEWKKGKKEFLKTVPAFSAGVALSLLPMIPWFQHAFEFAMAKNSSSTGGSTRNWLQIFELSYLTKIYPHVFGLNVNYTLRKETLRFFATYPWVPLMQFFIAVGSLFLMGQIWKERGKFWQKTQLAKNPWVRMTFVFIFSYGALLTVLGYRVQTHYFCALFPWTGVLLAYLIFRYFPQKSNWILPLLCAFQLITSSTLLYSLHKNGGAPEGEFGRSYR